VLGDPGKIYERVLVRIAQKNSPKERRTGAQDHLVSKHLFIVITHQGNIRKLLHTEEVSEGGGGALPEVLPAEVVLLRSLHCATQTRQVQFKTKQQSLDIYLAD